MNRILLIFFVLIAPAAIAQQTVTGTIQNEKSGETVPGVTVVEKGTNNGTTTNKEGVFNLTVKSDSSIIEIRSIGFDSKEMVVGQQSSLKILLPESAIQLQEVVVTALGAVRSKQELGYAVQRLDAKQISDVKSVNFVDNLAGKLAGVTVSQGATGVGSTSKITIRGEASFTNNNPLFVVDGIPINNNTVVPFTTDAAAGFQEIDFGNGAMEVNPDDIASVSVLKGPSAAALYGTRASNGVILINTKDGSESQELGISFNSSTYFERAFRLPQFQNDFGQGNSGEFEFVDGLGGGINDNITYSYGPRLDAGILVSQFDSPVTLANGTTVRGGDVAVHGGAPISATEFKSNPDNLKDFYETGITTINNIAVSSGYNKGHYRLSFTDLRSESIIPGVNLDRKTAAARLTFKPLTGLKIGTSINYVNSQSDNRPANGYGSENVNYSLVAWGPRSLDVSQLKDYWQPGLDGLQQYSYNYTFFDNPYLILLENRNSFNRDRVFGQINASYQFNDHLSLSVRSGMDYSNELREFRRAFSTNRFQSGAYAEHTVFFRENNTDFLLNYKRFFGDVSTDFSVGANRMDQEARTVQTQATSLAQPGIFQLSNAASPLEVFSGESRKRINSFYGIAKFGYKRYLFLDITGRNDWSSALATPTSTSNTAFFYPSVSSAFILSRVVPLPRVFSFAKVRASWAQVGNDTDPYQTVGVFNAQTPVGGLPTFSDQSTIANANLLPETTTSIEFGTDVRFFNDRLRFDVTYYNALTENQIISLPVAVSSGYTQQVVNSGAVRSKGIEITAGITPIKRGNFKWNTDLNFSRNVATVETLPEGAGTLTLAYSRVYDNVNQTVWFQVEEGGRIGDIYGTGYLKNEDGDFVLDTEGRYIVDNTLKKLGNYNPDFILGFNNQFSYKNFNLGFLIDWRQGGIIVSRTLSLGGVAGQLEETADRPSEGIIADGVVNVGTADNPQYVENTTAVSAESYYRQFYDRNHEENNVYNATYVKLREFTVGYTFRPKADQGFWKNVKSLRVSLIGRNLLAFSEIPHFDPEQLAVQGSQFVSGVEDMSYATTRSFGVKIGLNF